MKQQKNGLNQTINTSTANASTNIASQINVSELKLLIKKYKTYSKTCKNK